MCVCAVAGAAESERAEAERAEERRDRSAREWRSGIAPIEETTRFSAGSSVDATVIFRTGYPALP